MKKIVKIVLIIIVVVTSIIIIYKTSNIENKIYMYLYPKKYQDIVYKSSNELNIDPLLTFSIIKTESNFNANIVSDSGAIGLMQLMDNTAKEQAKKVNIKYTKEILYDPETNLKLGLNYFNVLLDYFGQNYILAFAAYNAGLGNVNKWINEGIIKSDGTDIENIPFKETNMYVRKVIKNYEIYKKLYL